MIGLLTDDSREDGGDAVRRTRVVLRGGFRSIFWRRKRTRRRRDRRSRRLSLVSIFSFSSLGENKNETKMQKAKKEREKICKNKRR